MSVADKCERHLAPLCGSVRGNFLLKFFFELHQVKREFLLHWLFVIERNFHNAKIFTAGVSQIPSYEG
jgi:hypothetical protein